MKLWRVQWVALECPPVMFGQSKVIDWGDFPVMPYVGLAAALASFQVQKLRHRGKTVSIEVLDENGMPRLQRVRHVPCW